MDTKGEDKRMYDTLVEAVCDFVQNHSDDSEKREMAQKHRFKKEREFKKRITEETENEEDDIRSFKFHTNRFADFEKNREDIRRGNKTRSAGRRNDDNEDNSAAGPHETADGDIQSVGAAGGEHHLFRAAGKQLRRRCPAVEHRPGRLHGGAVPAPARIGAGPQDRKSTRLNSSHL